MNGGLGQIGIAIAVVNRSVLNITSMKLFVVVVEMRMKERWKVKYDDFHKTRNVTNALVVGELKDIGAQDVMVVVPSRYRSIFL
jgi:hypothetical protein